MGTIHQMGGAGDVDRPSRWRAVLRGSCPKCRTGRIFSGRFAMNVECSCCGLVFEREPGYFAGAMYISYAIAVPTVAVLTVLQMRLLPEWSLERAITVSGLCLILLAPVLFRYSRILWIHFDRAVDP